MDRDSLVSCRCGANLPPRVLLANDHRCPECRRYHERCPGCLAWTRPFDTMNPHTYCGRCGLSGRVKSDLRLGRATIKSLRKREDVPQFPPLSAPRQDARRRYNQPDERAERREHAREARP